MQARAVSRHLNIPYAEMAGETLYLDIAQPVGARDCPVILVAHCGGWCMGDRRSTAAAAQRCARAGYVAVNLDYRLAPAHPFPAALEDLYRAVAWVGAHVTDYGGHPERLGAFGISAGGHLAALLATDLPTPLACAISWGGPMDLRNVPVTPPYRSFLLAFMSSCLHDDPVRYALASPACRVRADMPPLLLLQGSEDDVVPAEQSQRMTVAAAVVGAPVRMMLLPGAGHEPGDPRDPVMADAWDGIFGFLQDKLALER